MREVITPVFEFEELSEDSKEKALQWYREASEYDEFFAESVIENAAEIADIMGLDIRQTRKKRVDGTFYYDPSVSYSGFYSQGDGASYEGSYKYRKGALKELKAYCNDVELFRICEALQNAQRKVFYGATCEVSKSGYYSHSGTMNFEVEIECSTSDKMFNEVEEEIGEALKDFADWIYHQLEKEYEYQNSDEVVQENIICNEHEFTEDGKFYP